MNTLRQVFAVGFASFNTGPIRLLPGSEMAKDATVEKFELKTKFRFISNYSGIYDGEPVCEYEDAIVETSTMSQEEMFSLRVVHFLCWSLWNSGLAQPLLRHMHKVDGVNPLDSMLVLANEKLEPELAAFFEEYGAEASTEWFDTADELLRHFKKNSADLVNQKAYLKLNLKYLAKMLLKPSIAQMMLEAISKRSESPIAGEIVDFCLERMFFIPTRTHEKQKRYSHELVEALASLYPTVSASGPLSCRFSMSEKNYQIFEMEFEHFEFDSDPVRAVTLALQNYGTFFNYDFDFVACSEERLDPLVSVRETGVDKSLGVLTQ